MPPSSDNKKSAAQPISIMWFRRDLRLADNPAFLEAVQSGKVLPIYIVDPDVPNTQKAGEASQVWLHHSLRKLAAKLNNRLNFYAGDSSEVIAALIHRHSVCAVYCNACPEPWQKKRDRQVGKLLQASDIELVVFNSNYLWDKDVVLKDNGTFYKVYSAFKRKSYTKAIRSPVTAPQRKRLVVDHENTASLESLRLLPRSNWYKEPLSLWKIGEEAAHQQLQKFIESNLSQYQKGRDQPSLDSTSKLSCHLHFGEISPAQVWEMIVGIGSDCAGEVDTDCFLSEILWREFSAYLLHHIPNLPEKNINPKFDSFPWVNCIKRLDSWKRGQTGYPLVDAGMRELWQTGYMHNRVRMVVASFLVKNLMIHWHHGRDWFFDCLFDADLANNSASWQWVAGSGVDAAPFFRIFNPTTQGEKFDRLGLYTRQFVPELKLLPNKYLFKPWEAPIDILAQAGIVLGETYPHPVIDLRESRQKALRAYKELE